MKSHNILVTVCCHVSIATNNAKQNIFLYRIA